MNDLPASANEHILVVEDESAVARALVFALEQEGWRVTLARTAADALAAVDDLPPALALLDVRLPDSNGFDLCRAFRQHHRFPILFLTARDDLTDKVLGLELGADDYMTKPFAVRELVSRIRALLRRAYGDLASTSFDALDGDTGMMYVRDLKIDLHRRRVSRHGERIDLTAIEFDLLRVLATRPGVVFSREAIIREVWGYDSFVGDVRTVNVHISHLREKLETDPEHPLILTERGVGYKFAE